MHTRQGCHGSIPLSVGGDCLCVCGSSNRWTRRRDDTHSSVWASAIAAMLLTSTSPCRITRSMSGTHLAPTYQRMEYTNPCMQCRSPRYIMQCQDQCRGRWATCRRARDAEQLQAADSSHAISSSPQPADSDTASLYRLHDLSLKASPPDACCISHGTVVRTANLAVPCTAASDGSQLDSM